MADCKHPIWIYLSFGQHPQRHKCVDCDEEAEYVPNGSVMIGHAPGECNTCDKYAAALPSKDKTRWIEMTNARRT